MNKERCKNLTVEFTEDEKEAVRLAAKAEGMTMSGYARAVIKAATKISLDNLVSYATQKQL